MHCTSLCREMRPSSQRVFTWKRLKKSLEKPTRLLLVGGLEHYFYFSINWECHHPNWLSYFSEGLKPPTRLDVTRWLVHFCNWTSKKFQFWTGILKLYSLVVNDFSVYLFITGRLRKQHSDHLSVVLQGDCMMKRFGCGRVFLCYRVTEHNVIDVPD